VEKGTAVEFAFVGSNSDRDYEAMFLLEEPVGSLCTRLESAGLGRGKPVDISSCRLWPVGRSVSFEPPLSDFIAGKMPEGLPPARPIYTGGTRDSAGKCEASEDMPASFFALYSLSQSPVVYNGIYDQGTVYGAFTAKKTLKKGTRIRFTMSWADDGPKAMNLTAKPRGGVDLIRQIKEASKDGELDVTVGFDERLTVAEAKSMACALSAIDSPAVKINGCSNVFYRAFMPLVKWTDRQQRLQQPFELTLGNPNKLVYIEEDWSAPGDDPKLTERIISFNDATKYPKTDTCFIFAQKTNTVAQLVNAMAQLKSSHVRNWYVFDAP